LEKLQGGSHDFGFCCIFINEFKERKCGLVARAEDSRPRGHGFSFLLTSFSTICPGVLFHTPPSSLLPPPSSLLPPPSSLLPPPSSLLLCASIPLSVVWWDDNVDAGRVVRLLAAGDGSVVEGEGKVVIDELREDGEELVGPVGGGVHVSAVHVADETRIGESCVGRAGHEGKRGWGGWTGAVGRSVVFFRLV
jgi:hypothetical protein